VKEDASLLDLRRLQITAKLLAQDLDATPAAKELSPEPPADQAMPGTPRERQATRDGPPRAGTSPTARTGRGR
jgi:hypothetical protein